MSETFIVLIPDNINFIPSKEQILKIDQILQIYFDFKVYYKFEINRNIEFYDPGMNFEEILCPFCNTVIQLEWWQAQMGKYYIPNHGFQHLEIETPCCQKQTTLNALKYNFKAGFSRFAIIINDLVNLEQDIVNRISMELQGPLKIIYRRI